MTLAIVISLTIVGLYQIATGLYFLMSPLVDDPGKRNLGITMTISSVTMLLGALSLNSAGNEVDDFLLERKATNETIRNLEAEMKPLKVDIASLGACRSALENLTAQHAVLKVIEVKFDRCRTVSSSQKAALDKLNRDLKNVDALAAAKHEAKLGRLLSALGVVAPGDENAPGGQYEAAMRAIGDLKMKLLLREIERVKESATSKPKTMGEIRNFLDNDLGLPTKSGATKLTSSYSIARHPDGELVTGAQGAYFIIDLKNATSGVRFNFPIGKYVLDTRADEFRNSLQSFKLDITDKLQGNVDYRLFVRGSADAIPFNGRLVAGREYRHVEFLKAVGSGRYINIVAFRSMRTPLSNNDLPFLRAAFLQEVVADVLPAQRPTILEGGVTDKIDAKDRNAELILYVASQPKDQSSSLSKGDGADVAVSPLQVRGADAMRN